MRRTLWYLIGMRKIRRTHQLKIMVSEDELEAFRRIAAEFGGISVADVIRMWLHDGGAGRRKAVTR
jgi:hypothetical protein